MNCMKGLKIIGLILAGLLIAALFGLVLGLVVMWLWNALMPDIFGLPEIGYWQAVGLFLLFHLLFGGHPHGSSHDDCSTSHRKRVLSHHGHGFHGTDPFEERIEKKIKSWLNCESDCSESGQTTPGAQTPRENLDNDTGSDSSKA